MLRPRASIMPETKERKLMAEPAPREAPGRLLKMADVVRETSLHRATIYRRISDGSFPKPIPLGRQRAAWAERAIEAWKLEQLSQANN